MINAGVNVHKKRCAAAVKGDPGKLLPEHSTSGNGVFAATDFAANLKERYSARLLLLLR